MGEGRKTARRTVARNQGDLETANALAPPSEKRLTEEEKCGALTQKGTPCQQRKGSRTDHPGYGNCVKHGGNTEAGVKSAMREMGRDLAHDFKASQPFGGSRHDPTIAQLTPEQALLEEVRRTAAFVRFLEERIGRWNLTPAGQSTIEKFANTPKYNVASMRRHVDEVLRGLDSEDPDHPDYLPPLMERDVKTGFTSFTDAREWLVLYREERMHLARVSKMCIDAGVAQRMVSIAEDQGRVLASAIRAVLLALNLSPEQAAQVPHVVPPILRAVATDSPLPDPSLLAPSAIEAAPA